MEARPFLPQKGRKTVKTLRRMSMDWNLEEAVEYYRGLGAPGDQSAVIGLLREVQRESGGAIPPQALAEIGKAYAVKEGFLLALIRRIPSLRLGEGHCLEICGGPNCGKRANFAKFLESTYGEKPADFTVKFVPCMRMCGKGPNIRWDGKLFHRADEALIRGLIEGK